MSKITIIAPSVSGGGGAEKTAVLLSNALADAEYNVTLCVMSRMEPKYDLSKRVKYVKIDENISSGNIIVKNYKRIQRLKKILMKETPDIVIGYTIQGGIISCIMSKLLGTKTIVCERQDPNRFPKSMRLFRNFLYRFATGAVLQTQEAQLYFRDIVKNSVVIPNFVDLSTFPKVVDWSERENTIVAVGRLVEAKDHKTLIRAFIKIQKEFPGFLLKIWGEGKLENKLQKLISDNNMEGKIILCGRSDNVLEHIRRAKLFVLSSLYEGYPNALLEAMVLGIPSISTNCPCGGPADLIRSGENGFLVSIGDEIEMADAMKKILLDVSLAKQFSSEATKKREMHNSDTIIIRWIDYIRSFIDE